MGYGYFCLLNWYGKSQKGGHPKGNQKEKDSPEEGYPVENADGYGIISFINSINWERSMGLAICAFMPLSNDFFLSSSKALADKAIMGILANRGSSRFRMVWAAKWPSMTGIWISIRISVYSPGFDCITFSTAIRPC